MKPSTQKAFDEWAKQANFKTMGLAPDLERFFDFVIEAYKNGDTDIQSDDFIQAINAVRPDDESEGMSPAQRKNWLVSKMVMFYRYEDGMRLLKKFVVA